MQLPATSVSAERILFVFGQYHLSRLRADPQAGELVEPFERAQDALTAHLNNHREFEVRAMTALARRDAKDDELDDVVRGFYFSLLQRVVNDRKDPLFVRYFPGGLTPLIGQPHENEVRAVGILLEKLETEEIDELRIHAVPIRTAAVALTTALEEYKQAVDAERLAVQNMSDEKLRWIDAYKHSYRKLQLLFYKESKKAERYFRPVRPGSRDEGDEVEAEEVDASVVATGEPIVADRDSD